MALLYALAIIFPSMANAIINEHDFARNEVITRDVVILGAGASGTYAAVRLREDYNKSIIIVETDDHIGGHTNTYIEPETRKPVDFGVLSYWDYGPAKAFFVRMDVETVPAPQDSNTVVYVDDKTARNLSSYITPGFPDVLQSVEVYGNESKKYSDMLLPGYWDFPSGDQIPSDLLLPFSEFAQKYGIQNAYPLMQIVAGVGVGGVRNVLTFYVMGLGFGQPACEGIIQSTLFAPKSGSNSELYEKAYALLKDDILLSSSVIKASRNDSGVLVTVRNSDGTTTLIKAKQLLVTAAPSLSNLASLDLDEEESTIFGSSTPRPVFEGLLKTSIIPRNFSVEYVSSAAAPDNYPDLYNDLPHDLKIQSTGPEGSRLFRVLLETTYVISEDEAKDLIRHKLATLKAAGTFDSDDGNTTASAESCDVEFKAFVNHNSILWRLPAEDLRAGFMQKLYALQGRRSTWYTGSLWSTDFASNVWAFTDTVLERMME